jgi:hypothetical protein
MDMGITKQIVSKKLMNNLPVATGSDNSVVRMLSQPDAEI